MICKAPLSVQRAVEALCQQMAQDGETEREYFCRWCRSYHTAYTSEAQRQMLRLPDRARRFRRRTEPQGPTLPAPCAYCGADLLVSAAVDQIGRPTWGRSAKAITEQCPRCDKANLVTPATDRRSIRTARTENGNVALQRELGIR